MLLEYSVTNFKSFKEEAYLDLRPAKGKILKRFPGNYVELSTGERVLKDAVIVGENAGGKSNFIDSLVYLRGLMVRTDMRPRSMKQLINSSFLIEGNENSNSDELFQEYSAEIALPNATYAYSLKLAEWGVASESLKMRSGKNKPEIPIFAVSAQMQESCADCERGDWCRGEINGEDGKCICMNLMYGKGGSLREEDVGRIKDSIEDFSGLTLVWLAAVGDEHCRRVLNWFTDNLLIVHVDPSRSIQATHEASDLYEVMQSEVYLSILKLVDGSIFSLDVDRDHPLVDSEIMRKDGEGRVFKRLTKQDSAGVRTFLLWAYYIYKVIYENKTVFADEIDITINPVLSERVMALINGADHYGQLVLTTHNVFNLTLRTCMKEQIYFVTKDPMSLESTLYSAADFDEIRYDVKQELYEFYLSGMLGGTVHA